MSMRTRVARLFTVKTRFEAFLVIYAIAVGAVERGFHYMQMMPGWPGMLLAAACTGVVFVAGPKLLDAIKAEKALAAVEARRTELRTIAGRPRRRGFNRTRPRSRPMNRAAASRWTLHTD
ncbi:MAG TPA: hypothetical protein VHM21_02070 [Sphingomicrobium sp.]|jgi:hypothetical protein|nr:hypothetical protein [Sphingomicrobium sp.]